MIAMLLRTRAYASSALMLGILALVALGSLGDLWRDDQWLNSLLPSRSSCDLSLRSKAGFEILALLALSLAGIIAFRGELATMLSHSLQVIWQMWRRAV